MKDPGHPLTIGLLWHSFSSDNLGVGALSESQIAILEEAASTTHTPLKFIVFGTFGGRSYAPSNKDIAFAPSLSIRELLKAKSTFLAFVRQCDIVLDIGEGDSFTDIYGAKRFRRQVLSKLLVLWARKPLVLSPQTIGPFEHPWSRWIAKWIMRRCVRVFARDTMSKDYLISLGMHYNSEEAIDVAFRLPFSTIERPQTGSVRIGVNVSGLLFYGGYEGGNQFGLTIDYPALVRGLLERWLSDDRNEVWLVPHVLSNNLPRDDDRRAIEELCKEFRDARRAPDFRSPSEAKSFIASLDFLTGARMHACIAALSAGVAVYPIAYSRKFNGLFSSLGYPWLADGRSMNTAEALRAISEGLLHRDRLASDARRCAPEIDRRLKRYTDFLSSQITDLIQGGR